MSAGNPQDTNSGGRTFGGANLAAGGFRDVLLWFSVRLLPLSTRTEKDECWEEKFNVRSMLPRATRG